MDERVDIEESQTMAKSLKKNLHDSILDAPLSSHTCSSFHTTHYASNCHALAISNLRNEKELVIMLKMNEKAPSRISDDYHPVKTEKQTFKSEVAKMKSLGLKGGLQYFWMYYKIPVLIIVLVIVCGISMSMAIYENTKPVLVYANFVNNSTNLENVDDLFEEQYSSYLGEDPDKTNVVLETGLFYSAADTGGQNQTVYQKLMAEIGAGTLDVLGGDKEVFYAFNDKLGESRYCYDLTEILPPDLYEMFQDKFYYMTDIDGTQIPVGIDFTSSQFYSDMQLQANEYYIGMPASGDKNRFLNFLRYSYGLAPVLESEPDQS